MMHAEITVLVSVLISSFVNGEAYWQHSCLLWTKEGIWKDHFG